VLSGAAWGAARRFAVQCAAVGRRDAALQRSYGPAAWVGVLAAALGLVSYFFIDRLVGAAAAERLPGGSYFAFVWTGTMVQLAVAATLGALGGALAREAAEGTLEPALAAGASPLALVLGATLVPGALAVVQIALHAALGIAWFGLALEPRGAGVALVALLATTAACAPVGLLGAALWLVVRRAGAVTTAALFAFGLLGGVYFPVDLLPVPVASVAAWIPLTLGLDAIRGAVLDGGGWSACALPLAKLCALALVGIPPAAALLAASVRRAERRGRLVLA